jgi:hypothetical protein
MKAPSRLEAAPTKTFFASAAQKHAGLAFGSIID